MYVNICVQCPEITSVLTWHYRYTNKLKLIELWLYEEITFSAEDFEDVQNSLEALLLTQWIWEFLQMIWDILENDGHNFSPTAGAQWDLRDGLKPGDFRFRLYIDHFPFLWLLLSQHNIHLICNVRLTCLQTHFQTKLSFQPRCLYTKCILDGTVYEKADSLEPSKLSQIEL